MELASHPGRFIPGIHCIGGGVGETLLNSEKLLDLAGNQTQAVQLVATPVALCAVIKGFSVLRY
jgi:hypothetical protein